MGQGRKECDYCIFSPCTAYIHVLDLVLDCRRHIAYNYVFCELSHPGAVTRKVVQNTRPSFSHVRGGSGHETTDRIAVMYTWTPCWVPYTDSWIA